MHPERVGIIGLGATATEAIHQLLEDGQGLDLAALASRKPARVYIETLRWNSHYPERPVKNVTASEGEIIIDGGRIPFQQFEYRRDENEQLINVRELRAWTENQVAIALEATGTMHSLDEALMHINQAGVAAVVIASPAKDKIPSFCIGINENQWDPSSHPVVATESCTTNCAVYPIKILDEHFGVERIFGVSTHIRTGSNQLIDRPNRHEDPRRSRAATVNIIPTTTGAQEGVLRLLPQLADRGVSVKIRSRRVPVDNISLLDLDVTMRQGTQLTTEKLMDLLTEHAQGPLQGIMGIAPEYAVSTMFVGQKLQCIIDPTETIAEGRHATISAWYPNIPGPITGALSMARVMASKL